MSVGGISSISTLYQTPVTPQAQATDEQTESAALRSREAATGKDAAVPVKSSSSNAVDIKA